jgi:hypothetical protein
MHTPERQSNGEVLIELLLIELGDGNLRTEGRRAFRDAMAAFPDQESGGWWRWTIESLGSVGKRAKVLEATPRDALELIDEGAALILCSPTDPNEWLAVVGRSSRKFLVIDDVSKASSRRVSRRSLKSALSDFSDEEGHLRCVAMEPGFGRHPGQESVEGHLTPFARLRALLQPEASDITRSKAGTACTETPTVRGQNSNRHRRRLCSRQSCPRTGATNGRGSRPRRLYGRSRTREV